MNYRLVPSAEADNDVFDIACYLSAQREGLGFRFFDAVDATYQQITDNPERKGVGPFRHPRARDIRIWSIIGFSNYLIFYRIGTEQIEILRVLHGARDYMNLFDAEPSD